ncbi:hypothetical protein KAR91_85315, partial [Candidatus Pacearchaeota archaeon]|nr:hypothetical protein [Candidatus Pacearchaeota archaeon]
IVILIFIILTKIFGVEEIGDQGKKKIIRRTIVILPLYNQNNISKYDYLSDAFRNNLKRNLKEYFNIINFESVDNIINELGKKTNITESDAEKIALKLGADTVVFGKYEIIDNAISFFINSLDVITLEEVVNINIKGQTGFDILRYINDIAQEVSSKIISQQTMYNKKLINKFLSKDKMSKNRRQIIENLLNQTEAYWNIIIKRAKFKQVLKIPFAKNIIIFISEFSEDYAISIDGKIYEYKSKVKIMAFDNQAGKTREFKIYNKDNKPITYKYTQKNDYDVNIKYIRSFLGKGENKYSIFIDNIFNGSTSGYMGYDFRIGLGLPLRSSLENNIYIRTFIGPKGINYVEIKDGIIVDKQTHLKLKFGMGYEHVFFIKNFIGIHIGFEAGAEINFYSFLIKNNEKLKLGTMIFGCPSIYYSIPFAIQFFANKKISFIIGVEPILRLVMNSFYYDDIFWLESLDETRGAGFKQLRHQVSDYLTLDLFFYDMPIIMGMRIKI